VRDVTPSAKKSLCELRMRPARRCRNRAAMRELPEHNHEFGGDAPRAIFIVN
jgi:hypothetical protein